ncbi:hemerythrin family protein [Pseudodesulfovibrio sp. zrk46]|uniref:bacteriohemerythrin n=1 Tax=Pseudodesulfovibrio sp. zrk46 TaxID=2725288 RepID=UPI0014497D4B|nr:hemerythrin family protein [Pseudodesulfovibrio sp. zrk46]QJB56898.1 hemerythrin family protein [Pseudodesulfovibrio sp. zrk46]
MLLTQQQNMDPKELAWRRWVLQSGRLWADVSGIISKINIQIIDDDHKRFTQYALDLNLIIQALSNRDVSFYNLHRGEEIFENLIEYAEIHFGHEQQIMKEMETPLMAMHMGQHAKFQEMIDNYYKDFKRGRLQMVSGLKLSILDWWVNHINVTDYKTFVLGKKDNKDQEK